VKILNTGPGAGGLGGGERIIVACIIGR